MSLRPHHGAPTSAHARVAARRRSAIGWSRSPRGATVGPSVLPGLVGGAPENLSTTLQAEELWERHGASAYALACALLGDEAAASRTVTLAITDLVRSADSPASDTGRTLARHVYWRSQEIADDTTRTLRLPPTMVWLGQLAQLQRTCLGLCLFGGHTHREAADLLGVPADMVATSLTSGLKELGHLAVNPTG